MKYLHWCSKEHPVYKYSKSQPIHLQTALFKWQMISTLNSGHYQAMKQE